MGQVLINQQESWQEGVLTHPRADLLPPGSSPRGYNSYLVSFGAGTAVPATRAGCTVQNTAPVSGSPAIVGQVDYKRQESGNFTTYHLLISDSGRLDYLNSGMADVWDSADPSPFTGPTIVDTVVANNVAFMVTGVENRKATVVGGVHLVQNVGIVRPVVGSLAGAAGAAGDPNGTYELRVTYYNSHTGQESSISDTAGSTVALASQVLSWSNVPISSDSQVTHRYLYIRNTATQDQFYRAGEIADNTTTTASTDFIDTNLIIVAPDTEENNPPPIYTTLVWHQSRLFGAGPAAPSLLYYSKLGLPEAVDPEYFEQINPDDGQAITALYSAHEILIIFKRDAMYALYGDDPASWQIRCIDPEVGCIAVNSIQTIEGTTYWWSENGPVAWDGSGVPQPIALDLFAPTVGEDNLSTPYLLYMSSAIDEPRQHLLFAVPQVSEIRNTIILPYNYRLRRWVSDKWDIMDFASLCVVVDGTTNLPEVMAGGYMGQVFKLWEGTNDGAMGTMTGTFVASSSSISSFTDSGATFDTVGSGLMERYVRVINASTGDEIARRKITSNTATDISMASAVGNLSAGITYSYVIAGIDFQWDTDWIDFDQPFYKKRYEYVYSSLSAQGIDVTVFIDVFRNGGLDEPIKTWPIDATSGAGVWDQDSWDQMVWAGTTDVIDSRLRVGFTAKSIRLRVRNRQPDEPMLLLKLGTRAELMTDRR